jgi:hypothetical protein
MQALVTCFHDGSDHCCGAGYRSTFQAGAWPIWTLRIQHSNKALFNLLEKMLDINSVTMGYPDESICLVSVVISATSCCHRRSVRSRHRQRQSLDRATLGRRWTGHFSWRLCDRLIAVGFTKIWASSLVLSEFVVKDHRFFFGHGFQFANC